MINSCNDLALGHCKDAKMRSSVQQQLWCVVPENIGAGCGIRYRNMTLHRVLLYASAYGAP